MQQTFPLHFKARWWKHESSISYPPLTILHLSITHIFYKNRKCFHQLYYFNECDSHSEAKKIFFFLSDNFHPWQIKCTPSKLKRKRGTYPIQINNKISASNQTNNIICWENTISFFNILQIPSTMTMTTIVIPALRFTQDSETN